jgi:methionine-rich copper-binding protein CopC
MKKPRWNPRRALVPALLSAVVALALPAPASAHVEIVAKSPSGTAKTNVKRVTVTLSGLIRSGTLEVRGPKGEKVSRGSGGRDPHNFMMVSVALRSGLAPGRYTAKVGWVSADGHRQQASFGFRLKR